VEDFGEGGVFGVGLAGVFVGVLVGFLFFVFGLGEGLVEGGGCEGFGGAVAEECGEGVGVVEDVGFVEAPGVGVWGVGEGEGF